MFKTNLPVPALDDLIALQRDTETRCAAFRLRADLVKGIQCIEPETLIALANEAFPDESACQALAKFGLEVTATLHELAYHGADVRSLLAAERDRLEPLKQAAVKRLHEAVQRLGNIPRIIASAEGTAREKREELKRLGVEDLATLERAAPMPNRAAFEREARSLEAEIIALEAFIRDGDESILPPGIEPAPVREEVRRHVEQKSRMAKLADEVAAILATHTRH